MLLITNANKQFITMYRPALHLPNGAGEPLDLTRWGPHPVGRAYFDRISRGATEDSE